MSFGSTGVQLLSIQRHLLVHPPNPARQHYESIPPKSDNSAARSLASAVFYVGGGITRAFCRMSVNSAVIRELPAAPKQQLGRSEGANRPPFRQEFLHVVQFPPQRLYEYHFLALTLNLEL